MTASSKSAAAKTAEEINQRAVEKAFDSWDTSDLHACRRCGRSVGPITYQNINQLRFVSLKLPPEEGRVRPKEYHFHMCRWCVTEFLKFMMEKRQQEEKK